MATEYSQELKQTLEANPRIKTVYFDKEGNHYFNAFPRNGGFVVGNTNVEPVTREEILGAEPNEGGNTKPINRMNVDELKAECLRLELPQEEWQDLSKKDLVAYLTGKQ